MAQTLPAPPVSPSRNPAEILRRMPTELLDYSATPPDTSGSAGFDHAGPKVVPSQLDDTMKLAFAAARGDEALADDSWAAANLVFTHQTKAGDFGGSPTTAAISLCALSRSLLVIQQSPLADHFKERIDALKPAIAKAMHWLTAQQARLLWEDRARPDRLFSEAESFLFCGRLLGDESLLKAGHQFLDKGMKLYRPADGVFLEKNGADTSYEAASLVRLQEIVLQFPDRSIEESLARAVQWELAHIGADGAVRADGKKLVFPGSKMLMGPEKEPNVGEIALALLYYHERTGDAAALAAGERLHQHYAPQH